MMVKFLSCGYFLVTLPFLSSAFISPAASSSVVYSLFSASNNKIFSQSTTTTTVGLDHQKKKHSVPLSSLIRFSGGAYGDRSFATNAYGSQFEQDRDIEVVDASTGAAVGVDPAVGGPVHLSLPSFIPDPLKSLHLSFLEGNQTRLRGSETFSDFILHVALTGATVKILLDNNVLAIPTYLIAIVWLVSSKLFPIGETSYTISEKTSIGTSLKYVLTGLTSIVAGILPGLAMYLPSLAGGGSSAVPPFTSTAAGAFDAALPMIKPWYLILYIHAFQLNLLFDKQKESLFFALPLFYYLADMQKWSWLTYFNDPLIMAIVALATNYFLTIPRKVHPDQYMGGMVDVPRKYVPPNHDLTVLNSLLYFGLQLGVYKGIDYLITYIQALWNA